MRYLGLLVKRGQLNDGPVLFVSKLLMRFLMMMMICAWLESVFLLLLVLSLMPNLFLEGWQTSASSGGWVIVGVVDLDDQN
jgi:hypothetical protein